MSGYEGQLVSQCFSCGKRRQTVCLVTTARTIDSLSGYWGVNDSMSGIRARTIDSVSGYQGQDDRQYIWLRGLERQTICLVIKARTIDSMSVTRARTIDSISGHQGKDYRQYVWLLKQGRQTVRLVTKAKAIDSSSETNTRHGQVQMEHPWTL